MDDSDRIAQSRSTTVGLVVVGALLVGGIAWGLPRLGHWLLDLPWVPFAGPIRLALQVADHVPTVLFVLGGIILGAVLGAAVAHGEPVITVSEREIVITRGSQRQRYARAQVGGALVQGRRFTVRDPQDVDLAELTVAGRPEDLTTALQRHGWS